MLSLDNTDTSQIDTIEVHGAKWIKIDDLLQMDINDSIKRMAEKTQKLATNFKK